MQWTVTRAKKTHILELSDEDFKSEMKMNTPEMHGKTDVLNKEIETMKKR